MSNKIHKLLVGCICILFFSCSNNDTPNTHQSYPDGILFVKTLGGSKIDSGHSITKTSDGGYAILGHTQSNDGDLQNKTNDSFDYWVLKFDSSDNLEWQKNYGGTNADKGTNIIQTLDNGFAILGYSKSNDGDVSENFGFEDFWILKLDVLGNITWEKSFGFSGEDKGISLIQTKDGGYLLTGVLDVASSNGQGNSKSLNSKRHTGGDYWVIKIDSNGEKQWSRFFGGTLSEVPYGAFQTPDNSYIIIGSSDSADSNISGNIGSYDFWIIKINETGNLIWEKSFGGSQIDEAHGITATSDGNYVIAGDTRSNDFNVSKNNGDADLWVIKISAEGDLIWEKTFGGSRFDVARSIKNTSDNGFIISGSSISADGDVETNKGQNDAWIIKIDADANLEWQKTIGGSDVDFAYDAVELNNGTIVVVGETNSNDFDVSGKKGFTDLLIFKID